ncbi:MAG: PHB depolymerase family esterase [Candidatus Omnitrophica bacterium]|nr:PHB depolymerase family esterase [Candidatus Omnitrophota bacterium]
MRKTVVLFFALSVFLVSAVFAQETLRERIRERVKTSVQKKTERLYGIGDPEFSLQHEGLSRIYKVHLPPNYDSKKAYPVVIYIHGGGGDMRAAYIDGLDKAADKLDFILVAPQGTGKLKLGHLRGVWNGGKWETGECCGFADDVGFISKMIDELKAKYNVDSKMIYATGISNGGLMTNRIGCELSDKIAAIAPVAGAAVESSCNPGRPMPVMDIHGTLDPANPSDGSEPRGIFAKDSNSPFAMPYKRMTPYKVADAWRNIDKCSAKQTVTYEKGGAKCVSYNECAEGSEVVLCIVEGMGHTYPGGAQYLTEKIVGPVSRDISFNQIWEFFKKHPKQ